MSTYQLNINISAADLSAIYAAKENVVLIKSVKGEEPYAWISFLPFQGNAVTWNDDYSIYETYQTESSGVNATFFTEEAALPLQNYNFLNDGTFSQPNPVPIGANSYQVTNQNTTALNISFGLAQTANVNGTEFNNSPVNAQFVPENQFAIFKPTDQITIFLASDITAGMFVDQDTEFGVMSQFTILTFENGVNEITVTYDDTKGGFVQNS
jgi:hypothetical protein